MFVNTTKVFFSKNPEKFSTHKRTPGRCLTRNRKKKRFLIEGTYVYLQFFFINQDCQFGIIPEKKAETSTLEKQFAFFSLFFLLFFVESVDAYLNNFPDEIEKFPPSVHLKISPNHVNTNKPKKKTKRRPKITKRRPKIVEFVTSVTPGWDFFNRNLLNL